MPVRRRGKRWRADFYAPDLDRPGCRRRYRPSLGSGVRTEAQAQALAADMKAELEKMASPDAERWASFSGFADHWFQQASPMWTASTRRSYETIIRVHLLPWFGDTDLRLVDTGQVEALRAALLETRAPKTVANVLAVLSSLFSDAVRWGYAEHNPTAGVELPKAPPPDFAFWNCEQSDHFLATCLALEPRWHLFFATGLQTGLRLGELFALRARRVLVESAHVDVRRSVTRGVEGPPKSGRARQVPAPPTLAQRLADRVAALDGDDLVFPGPDGGFLTRGMVKHPFARVTRAAGLPRIRIHDLRHSYASQLVLAGVPLPVVQQLLGHADIRTTMRYAHLAPSGLADFVRVLDEPGEE